MNATEPEPDSAVTEPSAEQPPAEARAARLALTATIRATTRWRTSRDTVTASDAARACR